MQLYFYRNTQSMHGALANNLRPYRIASQAAGSLSGQGLALMNELVTGQAALVAVIGQFKLLMIAMLVVSPLALLLYKPRPGNIPGVAK